jgi:sorbitol/mannitol transport system permease protein
MNTSKQHWINLGWTAFTYIAIGVFIFPVIWMVVTGFKQEVDASTTAPLIVFRPTLDQFKLVAESHFGAYLFNSLFASLVSTALALLLGIPAAYSMVFQMRTHAANEMLFFALSTRFMPFAAILRA